MKPFLSYGVLLLMPALTSASHGNENRSPSPQEKAQDFDPTMKFVTEGSVGPRICFRFGGFLQSNQTMYGLRRRETRTGPIFLLGDTVVTKFPEWIYLEVWLRQEPCSGQKGKQGPEKELSTELVKELELELSWKSGVHLRPVEDMRFSGFEVASGPESISFPAFPHVATAIWRGIVRVKSTGVPLTDSLVMILRTKEGEISARTSARF